MNSPWYGDILHLTNYFVQALDCDVHRPLLWCFTIYGATALSIQNPRDEGP
jgi:hypothetical protein